MLFAPEKNLVDCLCCIQLFIQLFRFAFISNGQLVLQIGKSVIDRSRTQHQHFGSDTSFDHFVHQHLIAILMGIGMSSNAVSEIVRFINHDQIVIAPVKPAKIQSVGLAFFCLNPYDRERHSLIGQPRSGCLRNYLYRYSS